MAGTVQHADRLELIRQAHKNFLAKQKMQARFVREENYRDHDDERHWTDASKYAKEYYGEVYHHTTRFDNDWD